ncbi:uncharacterized protein LOC117652536 isoform X2 [Thrips palmi]|uniref:Uncharacterized protein LOC117652536 isoform X2 n=1 Tax=Thrips palmi TaxID=161013 RepID=A0A6P9A7X1_THRPL|nr:uncharacterized protein LOC117652536 isoform X2 [Thrips palmi]
MALTSRGMFQRAVHSKARGLECGTWEVERLRRRSAASAEDHLYTTTAFVLLDFFTTSVSVLLRSSTLH